MTINIIQLYPREGTSKDHFSTNRERKLDQQLIALYLKNVSLAISSKDFKHAERFLRQAHDLDPENPATFSAFRSFCAEVSTSEDLVKLFIYNSVFSVPSNRKEPSRVRNRSESV